jgi:hypothetical protein
MSEYPASPKIIDHFARVDYVTCESAGDLLERLAPRGKLFGQISPGSENWVFRGHSQAIKHRLIPLALRPEAKESLLRVSGISPGRALEEVEGDLTNSGQTLAELLVFIGFCNEADKLGLPIPGGSIEMRNNLSGLRMHLEKWKDGGYHYWPVMFSLMHLRSLGTTACRRASWIGLDCHTLPLILRPEAWIRNRMNWLACGRFLPIASMPFNIPRLATLSGHTR